MFTQQFPEGTENPDAILNRTKLKEDLNWAASQGDVNEMKRLVVNGSSLDEGDYDGRTAIYLAASEGHENVIRYLIDKKVNLNPIDRWGDTPLDNALRNNHNRVVALLEGNGAKKGR